MSMNPLDRASVRSAFERAAGRYDAHAVLQQEVGRRLFERTEYLPGPPEFVLDVGCGTGYQMHQMNSAFPGTQVIGLDWSQAMLRQMRGQAAAWPVCADMQALPVASRSVDLVFSNLAAQWSPEPERLFAEMRRVLRPGGLLLFSTFGPDTLRELRAAWAEVDDRPHINQFLDLHDIGDMLMRLGFAEPVMDMDMFTVEYPDVLLLMRDLKAIGAHNSLAGRREGLTGKNRLRRVLGAYERFRQGDRYPATWEVVYGAAFGPVEGQPVRTPAGDVAEFSIDSLRSTARSESQ